jgi:hypothetical protein
MIFHTDVWDIRLKSLLATTAFVKHVAQWRIEVKKRSLGSRQRRIGTCVWEVCSLPTKERECREFRLMVCMGLNRSTHQYWIPQHLRWHRMAVTNWPLHLVNPDRALPQVRLVVCALVRDIYRSIYPDPRVLVAATTPKTWGTLPPKAFIDEVLPAAAGAWW